METPTISKKQQKKTLSAKKRKKETIKNVLAQPYDNYWPLLSPEDNYVLKEALERCLPRVKNEKISVPYREIKAVPKEERRKFRESFVQPTSSVNKTESLHLIFGVNDVTVALEKREISAILIASDVKPRLLVQHVLDLAVLYRIPVLVVSDLREIVRKCCGISGVTIGLRTGFEPGSKLDLIHQTIQNIHEGYPSSTIHIESSRQINNTATSVIEIESDAEDSCIISNQNLNPTPQGEISVIEIDTDADTTVENCDSDGGNVDGNWHLKRESKKTRVFVPQETQTNTSPIPQDCVELGWWSFAKSPSEVPVDTIYRALQVKRVKGNKDQTRRTLAGF